MKCDILVVGGGPAGLVSSALLSNKDYSICILEKKDDILSQNGKYDITEGNKIKEILEEIGIEANKKSNISEWLSPNHKYILDSNIEDFYFKRGYDEDSLESKLSTKIKEENTKFFYKSKINSIHTTDNEINEVEIISNNKKYTIFPKFVIIADGPDSETRQKLKIKKHIYAKFNGYGVLVYTEKNNYIPHAKIYFDKMLAPGGYLYSGSVGKETFYCIISDEKNGEVDLLEKNLQQFIKENIKEKYKQINSFKGSGISGTIENKFENAFFIGGAAFLNDPFLGYGLNFAIESAYYAANAIINKNTNKYKEYLKEMQRNFNDMFFAREIWRNANNDFFDTLTEVLNGEKYPDDQDIQKILRLFED